MRPLDGLTVLDLTRLLPGAFATLLLADLGARIIKVEDPRGGDPLRQMPPMAGGVGVYHRVLNRNKESVTLDMRPAGARDLRPAGARDLRAAGALDVLDRLLVSADVLVESFRPRTAVRLGISAAQLLPRHPRLVHCSITGYGQQGPYADRAGHDLNYVGLAGLLAVDRPARSQPPRMPRMLVADIGGGALSAVAGILAALVARSRTGRGCAVDVSMFEGALSWLSIPAAATLCGGPDPDPAHLPLTGGEACYNLYETADGEYLAVGALEPKFWARLCEALDRSDFIPLQFAGSSVQDRMRSALSSVFRTRTRDEWLMDLLPLDACITPVNGVTDALNDPHLQAREAVSRVGKTVVIRAPLRFAETGAGAGAADLPIPVTEAPGLGAHTFTVLLEAGLDRPSLDHLRSERIV